MNPDAPAINVRWSMLYNEIATDWLASLSAVVTDEKIHGKSTKLLRTALLTAAQHYVMLMYANVTEPYAGASDFDEVKEAFDYEVVKKCFACRGIYIDNYVTLLDIESISETGVDTINEV